MDFYITNMMVTWNSYEALKKKEKERREKINKKKSGGKRKERMEREKE